MSKRICVFIGFLFTYSLYTYAQYAESELEGALARYQQQLQTLRLQHKNSYPLPKVPFFLFGMGNRTKLVYKNGTLTDVYSGKKVAQFELAQERIIPNSYTVWIKTKQNETILIIENEKGIYIRKNGADKPLSESPLALPSFSESPYSEVLKVLHHEILWNIASGKPHPNILVYNNPWNRDAALMAMVLQKTNNLPLIKNWVLGLNNPFDYNNKGISEADNPGEVLYMLSLFVDKEHPLVKATLDSAKKFYVKKHLEGKTDFGDRYVYQTKWMKFGLNALGLLDTLEIPDLKSDNYSSLFWMAYTDKIANTNRFDVFESKDYPYLTWAEDHFYNEHNGYLGNQLYPLSWERNACCANYAPMKYIDTTYVNQRLSVPHTWHAAEMFLYLHSSTK